MLFHADELRHVDEILDPGLLLGRIGGVRTFPHSMSNQKPKTWKQTSHEWDSNRVYGLTLPKIVGSNRLTREQGIAGMDIMDVPLHKVIAGGNNNWALRQVAHGRTVQWENFRSRQEAIFCGVLMRGLRSEQAEQEGSDFVTILNACQKKYFPSADLHDWPARYNASSG